MERLTVRVKEGNRKDECFIPGNKNAIKKVEYICEGERWESEEYKGKAVDKLAEYEDLEEQNRLLKLPYAINDTVYYLDDITPFEEMPIEGRISGFRVTWCRTIVMHITTNFNDEGCLADRNEDIDVVAEEFGKTVFFTKEAAEAALKELERGKHERAGKDLDSG